MVKLMALLAVCVVSVSALLLLGNGHAVPPPSGTHIENALAYQQKGAGDRARAHRVGREPKTAKGQFHEHVAIRFIINDAPYFPPRDIGLFDAYGFLAIHTHDQSGVVHLHRPAGDKPFALSTIFGTWGVRYSPQQFAGWRIGKDGKEWRAALLFNGKPKSFGEDIEIRNHDDVVIILASPSMPLADPGTVERFDWKSIPLVEDKKL